MKEQVLGEDERTKYYAKMKEQILDENGLWNEF